MGACSVSEIRKGESAGRVFDKMCEEYIREYGDDSYNGTFSTCDFCGISLRMTGMFKQSNVKTAEKHIREHMDRMGKRDAYAVDMGIDHYEIVKTKLVSTKRKPSVHYFVANYETGKRVKTFEQLDKAKVYATDTATKEGTELYVGKCFSDQYGHDELFTTVTDVKIKKSKPKTVPKGAVLKEIHAYYFYGWAAE